MGKTGSGFDVQLPRSLRAERHDDVAVLFLARPQKRNAIDDPTVFGIEAFFAAVPDGVRAVVLAGEGDHFCSGLDLSELSARDAAQGVAHSRSWHRAFEHIEFGKVPVVAVLHGAVVGGGGSVRLPRLIGTSRMMDMMLTGRSYDAEGGQAIGISHYLVAPGEGLAKGIELAKRIAGNAPMTNFAVTQVLPRIAESDPATGYVTEALIAAIAQADGEAKSRLKAFLEKRAPKVVHKKTVRNKT